MNKLNCVEIKIVEHCNLSCTACGTYANLAEKEEYGLDNFERDVQRLSELYSLIQTLRLYGGEPLLNKEILEYIRIAKKHLPDTQVEIITNGFLLKKMDDAFFAGVNAYDAKIVISKYPFAQDKFFPLQKMDAAKVNYSIIDVNYFYVKREERASAEHPQMTFDTCLVPISLYVHHGKAYQCPYPLSIKHYDKKFKTKLENVNDGIDIHIPELTGGQLDERLKIHLEHCKDCTLTTGFVPCAQTRPTASDWDNNKQNENVIHNFQSYEFKLARKNRISYSVLLLQNNRFNLIYEEERQLADKSFYLLLRDQYSLHDYNEHFIKSLQKMDIKILKVIDDISLVLNEAGSIGSEVTKIVVLNSMDEKNLRLLKQLYKQHIVHDSSLILG
ncbi:Cyclic pyranopterin monophosphate synthase [compost metagenome]